MVKAFVLLTASLGAERSVFESLKTMPNIKEADMLYGVYDIIVDVEAESLSELKDVINYKIRRMDDVDSSVTMIVN